MINDFSDNVKFNSVKFLLEGEDSEGVYNSFLNTNEKIYTNGTAADYLGSEGDLMFASSTDIIDSNTKEKIGDTTSSFIKSNYDTVYAIVALDTTDSGKTFVIISDMLYFGE